MVITSNLVVILGPCICGYTCMHIDSYLSYEQMSFIQNVMSK